MREPDFDFETSDERDGYDMCYCGCTRAEHDEDMGWWCLYCRDCDGFSYDHDGTLDAACINPEIP